MLRLQIVGPVPKEPVPRTGPTTTLPPYTTSCEVKEQVPTDTGYTTDKPLFSLCASEQSPQGSPTPYRWVPSFD